MSPDTLHPESLRVVLNLKQKPISKILNPLNTAPRLPGLVRRGDDQDLVVQAIGEVTCALCRLLISGNGFRELRI